MTTKPKPDASRRDMSRALQDWTRRHRLTHAKAAAALGLPFRTFSNWYYGTTLCPVATLLAFRLEYEP